MKLSILNLLYQTSAFYWMGRHISPKTLFQLCRGIAGVSVRFNPHTKRYLKPLRGVLAPHVSEERLENIAEMHLVYRRYLDHLPYAWRRAGNAQGSFHAEGEEYLREALTQGRGAILLSSHNFGINRLIPSVMSRLGHRIARVGAWAQEEVVWRWGDETERTWEQLYLGTDAWSRIRVAKRIVKALQENSLVFMSIWNRPVGGAAQEVCAFGQRFFIDATTMRLCAELKAPVLPCFALCNDKGEINVIIHAPLGGDTMEMSRSYCNLLARYLTDYPEFCRFWKSLVQKKERW